MRRLPLVPMHNDNETGGSTAPPQKRTPILKSMVARPTDEAIRLELEARLEALEAAVRRSQEVPKELQKIEEPAMRNLRKVARREMWPLRDDDENPTPSSAEMETEGKKQRTDITSVY